MAIETQSDQDKQRWAKELVGRVEHKHETEIENRLEAEFLSMISSLPSYLRAAAHESRPKLEEEKYFSLVEEVLHQTGALDDSPSLNSTDYAELVEDNSSYTFTPRVPADSFEDEETRASVVMIIGQVRSQHEE